MNNIQISKDEWGIIIKNSNINEIISLFSVNKSLYEYNNEETWKYLFTRDFPGEGYIYDRKSYKNSYVYCYKFYNDIKSIFIECNKNKYWSIYRFIHYVMYYYSYALLSTLHYLYLMTDGDIDLYEIIHKESVCQFHYDMETQSATVINDILSMTNIEETLSNMQINNINEYNKILSNINKYNLNIKFDLSSKDIDSIYQDTLHLDNNDIIESYILSKINKDMEIISSKYIKNEKRLSLYKKSIPINIDEIIYIQKIVEYLNKVDNSVYKRLNRFSAILFKIINHQKNIYLK